MSNRFFPTAFRQIIFGLTEEETMERIFFSFHPVFSVFVKIAMDRNHHLNSKGWLFCFRAIPACSGY